MSEQHWSSTRTTEEDHTGRTNDTHPKVFAQWKDSKEAIEGALLESPTLRSRMAQRTEVLERVGELRLLPDGVHVTSAMVAEYCGVDETAIRQMVVEHRDELETNGYHTVTGMRLSEIKSLSGIQSRARSLALFTRRTILNTGMLLRDSYVARQVRYELLNDAQDIRPQPVENLPATPSREGSLDARIVRITERTVSSILSRTVVPMQNAMIETCSELHRDVNRLREDVDAIKATLYEAAPGTSRPELTSLMPAVDVMSWKQFEQHVAELCRRDGCTDIDVTGGKGDLSADVIALLPDGRRLVIQCKRQAAHRAVTTADMQQFIGAARPEHRADIALYAVTCRFTKSALALAARHGITVMPRELFAAWNAGARLDTLLLNAAA
ncbi:restriction endonuclease [Streptomyces dysideae]|uniref:restriction endonuclease n=1 Tax=Streptomyces dysideae TaxID=909626 RepID=UPI000A787092|nr:restriction endonuclease [Streptomyces dysideae]